MMSEKRSKTKYYLKSRQGIILGVVKVNEEDNVLYWNKVVDLLNGLAEENEQLREINKEIGDDLHNCRLNKNIIREKLKQWQEVHKEYNIYSIKGFEDLLDGLSKENEELKQRIALFEQQEDEFEQYTAQTIENMIANYRDD